DQPRIEQPVPGRIVDDWIPNHKHTTGNGHWHARSPVEIPRELPPSSHAADDAMIAIEQRLTRAKWELVNRSYHQHVRAVERHDRSRRSGVLRIQITERLKVLRESIGAS